MELVVARHFFWEVCMNRLSLTSPRSILDPKRAREQAAKGLVRRGSQHYRRGKEGRNEVDMRQFLLKFGLLSILMIIIIGSLASAQTITYAYTLTATLASSNPHHPCRNHRQRNRHRSPGSINELTVTGIYQDLSSPLRESSGLSRWCDHPGGSSRRGSTDREDHSPSESSPGRHFHASDAHGGNLGHLQRHVHP